MLLELQTNKVMLPVIEIILISIGIRYTFSTVFVWIKLLKRFGGFIK